MIANTKTRYGTVARTLHWAVAVLILAGFALGLWGKFTPRTAETVEMLKTIYSAHKTIGIAVLGLAILRVIWAVTQPRPVPLHPERKLETFAAETAHWVLYAALFILPLSGWVMHAAEDGFAPIWWPFGQDLPFVPKSHVVAGQAATVHWAAGIVLGLTLAAHIAGAFKHALIDRDSTLARMCFGTEAGSISDSARHSVAASAAAVIWAAVVATAVFAVQPTGSTVAAPETADGAWQVQEVDVAFPVTQFGSDVTGHFRSVLPDITFDPSTGTGAVRVVIDTGSLDLGSVTDQAQGAEFFDVAQFPQAVFEGAVAPSEGGYAATGTLTILGQTQDVALPFTLTAEGDAQRMTGQVALDRRDFGLGVGYGDESTVGFGVTVDVTVLARPPA